MSYKIDDFGPSDFATSGIEGRRRLKVSVNEQVIDGNKALTTQNFTELNVKSGNQFEAADYIAASEIEDVIIYTGSQQMLIKAIDFSVDGEGLFYQFFKAPTFDVANLGQQIEGYSLNRTLATTPESELYRIDDANVTDDGTADSPRIAVIGADTIGNASTPTFAIRGLERILPANTTYLMKRTKLDAANNAQQSAFYMTWYEGELSTETPLDI